MGEGGTINFYDGVQPANARAEITNQILLGTATFSFPCAEDANEGVLSFNEIKEESNAKTTGDTTWARIRDANENTIFDVDVTGPRGGGTLEINSTRIVEGGVIRVSSFTIVIPSG
jgi:hypothetical protein